MMHFEDLLTAAVKCLWDMPASSEGTYEIPSAYLTSSFADGFVLHVSQYFQQLIPTFQRPDPFRFKPNG